MKSLTHPHCGRDNPLNRTQELAAGSRLIGRLDFEHQVRIPRSTVPGEEGTREEPPMFHPL